MVQQVKDPANTPVIEDEIVDTETRSAENAFGLALMFSGVRCVMQYVFLPFVLPVIGLAGGFSAMISLVINTMAVAAIIFSVRTFWKVDYKYKWHYLPVAAVALLLLGSFILLDIATLA
jgi:hypothetical protein